MDNVVATAQGARAERRRNLPRVRDVAAYLGVSADTVYRMCRKHEIPRIKIRTRLRFDPEEFYRTVAEHRRGWGAHPYPCAAAMISTTLHDRTKLLSQTAQGHNLATVLAPVALEPLIIKTEHWSGRGDLNPRPQRPERCALPSCATPRPGHCNIGSAP